MSAKLTMADVKLEVLSSTQRLGKRLYGRVGEFITFKLKRI